MENSEAGNGATRDDLIQRIALMEAMIAEGRRSTARCGWYFILWGVVNLTGIGWQLSRPHFGWVWPNCLAAGNVLTLAGYLLQRRSAPAKCQSIQYRGVGAVWGMMGIAMTLYVGTALFEHFTWQLSYLAALLMIVGLAHAISAMILRWRVQGAVAALWWIGGVAIFFCRTATPMLVIMLIEMCLGMVAFGAYAMMLERRDSLGPAGTHAG